MYGSGQPYAYANTRKVRKCVDMMRTYTCVHSQASACGNSKCSNMHAALTHKFGQNHVCAVPGSGTLTFVHRVGQNCFYTPCMTISYFTAIKLKPCTA